MKLKSCHLAVLALLASPILTLAQTAVVSGNLYGFDVLNDTGVSAHGFEIQLEGAVANDLYYTFPGGRYGVPTVTPYANGVYVRWTSVYSGGAYTASTPVATTQTFGWQDCYQGGAGYSTSGCEHFGQSMRTIAPGRVINITGRWLIDDPATPGQLVAMDPPAAIPFPTWGVVTTTAAPVVTAVVAPPRPAPAQYGTAYWVKVFKTDESRSVGGDELSSTNTAVVPEDPTQVETSFAMLQAPPPGVKGKHGGQSAQSALSLVTGAVVRRYELYKYTGTYDPLTHEALCADLVCNVPATGELGAAISAQNTASNVVADSLGVAKTGSGASGATVSGSGVACGGGCAVFAKNGASFTLTANPGSSIFAGWGGICSGTQLTCSGTINGHTNATATFLLQYTVSIGRSNQGTVTATPSGNDRALNCGSNCSAKFTDGTVITLTATPAAGKQFVNWSGACSGTANTCTLTVDKNASVQAVFSK